MLQEKYRPKTLDELKHLDCVAVLKTFAPSNFPSLILAGPNGSGKRTLLHALIKHFFDKEVHYMSYTTDIEVSASKTLEVSLLESDEAIEVRVGPHGYYDKKVLQKIAKDISETKSIKGLLLGDKRRAAKLLIIPDGEELSSGAQMALRRIMEQGAENFRLIILTTTTNTFIDAFKSRFLICRVPTISDMEINQLIGRILTAEQSTLPEDQIKSIVKESRGNLHKVMAKLELALHTKKVGPFPWEESINALADTIILAPSIKSVVKARESIYGLLDKNIPGQAILSMLVLSLLQKEASVETAANLLKYASLFDSRLRAGTKDLFHLEAFVARAMAIYGNNSSINNK
ncbi:replication factor C subunit 3/5 [Nematocida homosporus]|uniref:replication factor C subunit 3/5 n=1 Tax=Nematocida homosporus TaxID=1912981 RepID=UPI002220C4CC|nr:replication factor C subunit 3/5 [Nematocida homosporus]KAI5185627.1 replication factor C subunit 3/5 [Nematocida homosporus]